MKFHLEADPGELEDKGESLIAELVKAFIPVAPDLAERLEKALPRKEPQLKFPVLRELHTRTSVAYQRQVKKMLAAIGEVLDRSVTGERVQKSETAVDVPLDVLHKAAKKLTKSQAAYAKVPGSLYACNECENWVPDMEKPTCVLHRVGEGRFNSYGRCAAWAKGEPIPQRKPEGTLTKKASFYRENEYHTGFKCNRCVYWIEGGKCERVAGDIELEATCKLWEVILNTPVPLTKSLEKAGPFIGPKGGKWADAAHKIAWKEKPKPTNYKEMTSQITGALRAAGLKASVFKPKKGIKKSGFKLSTVPMGGGKRVAALEWEDWAGEGDSKERMVEAVAALKDRGYLAREVVEGGGMYALRWVGFQKSLSKAEEGAEPGEEEEKLEPGDVDPESGELILEPEEEEEGEGEETEEEETEKALPIDHSKPIADKEDIAYTRIREVLKRRDYKDSDFDDKDGPLYGYSTNELIDLARDKRLA